MNRPSVTRLAAPVLMALCLNGCVAAALPALAGAVLVRNETKSEKSEPTTAVAKPAAKPAAPAEAAATGSVEVAAAPAATSGPAALPTALPAELPAGVMIGPAPPPDSVAVSNPALETPYLNLVAYARGQALGRSDPESPLLSAVLSEPSALNGKRKECLYDNPTVLIDLDPHAGSLAPEAAPRVPRALVEGLQTLRDSGIDIAWISGSSAAQAGDIRAALSRTGLDPNAKDRLILMRYPGDRKQTRRVELANESCLIAIAGDHREDFDELFEYLVNPESGLRLELLIGEGWFLVPPLLGKP